MSYKLHVKNSPMYYHGLHLGVDEQGSTRSLHTWGGYLDIIHKRVNFNVFSFTKEGYIPVLSYLRKTYHKGDMNKDHTRSTIRLP